MQKEKEFNHIKVHTQYSICEGAIKISELTEFFKNKKIKSIGISDTHNLSGVLEFSETVSKLGIMPIIGTQINFNYKNYSGLLPLIATNKEGYKNIVKLSSKSYLENNSNNPQCELDYLISNKLKGLIILSGSINSLFGKMFVDGKIEEIEKTYSILKKNYNDNFYIEIQRHNDFNEKEFENFNLNCSSKLNVPIIATHEVYYLDETMHEAHDALLCIGQKTYINEKNRLKLTKNHYFKSNQEMQEIFSDIPEALENNYNLPLRCSYRPKFSNPILPNIFSKEGVKDEQKLLIESENGLKIKFKNFFNISGEELNKNKKFIKYKKRLDHEIKIITEMKYSSYFLIVSDYIKFAKNNDIPVGPGRGSGAGSLVAWCLSITDIDPIKFNLIFERFLNPDRISMPDFDIDFCEEKRDMVFEYLKKKYKNNVAHIITFGKLKARMVIRDVGRVLGLPYGFVDSICKMIPFDPSRPLSLQECINNEPRLKKLIEDDKRVKKLIDLSLKLEGLNRNVATHAAGVVIADENLTETVPLYKDNSLDLLLPSTQFDMYSAENAGLVKFDFLGLKTLTVINKTEKLINQKKKEFKISNIEYDDQKVFELLSSGHTVGLFQLESSGMREALIQMKPNMLEDIIALVALYRPGPMSNIPIYNDCKHGIKEPDYLHEKLTEILKPTYGVIIYQEQVMQIAQKLSGFSAGEADLLRRAMGKKKRKELEKQKQRFINGAEKNGISKEVAASIFLKIEPFAEYGFNKSHAAAYAIIAYQTAYLKTYYPFEFFSASMSMELSNQKKLSEFYEELKRQNIRIIRPDINECYPDFTSNKGNFYYALGAIKNVGYEAISNIIKERESNGKFKSLNDFISRVDPKDINKLQLEGLTKAGAFDKLIDNRRSLYESIPNLITKSKNIFENKLNNQSNLFDTTEDENDYLLKKIEDWKTDEKLSNEFECLGFYISDHPLNQFKLVFEDYKIDNYNNFVNSNDIFEAKIAATILKVQEKKTQKGTSYSIIKFSDLSSVFELFIFSDIFELNRPILKAGNSILLTIIKSTVDERGTKRFNVKKIVLLKNVLNKKIENVTISINDLKKLKDLKNLLITNGDTEVNILVKDKKTTYKFKINKKFNIDRDILHKLKNKDISTIIN